MLLPQGQKIRKDMFFVIIHISQYEKNVSNAKYFGASDGAFQSGSIGSNWKIYFICLIFLKNAGLKVIFREDTAVFPHGIQLG